MYQTYIENVPVYANISKSVQDMQHKYKIPRPARPGPSPAQARGRERAGPGRRGPGLGPSRGRHWYFVFILSFLYTLDIFVYIWICILVFLDVWYIVCLLFVIPFWYTFRWIQLSHARGNAFDKSVASSSGSVAAYRPTPIRAGAASSQTARTAAAFSQLVASQAEKHSHGNVLGNRLWMPFLFVSFFFFVVQVVLVFVCISLDKWQGRNKAKSCC